MENAAEALKMAGFTLIFLIALAVCMTTVMQSKRVSEKIVSTSDRTNYYTELKTNEENFDDNNNRIVSKYDIIPTLYRYRIERYIILFKNQDGSPLSVYGGNPDEKTKLDENKTISYLNYELESAALSEDWTGSTQSTKEHVDKVVKNILGNSDITNFVETLTYEENNLYLSNEVYTEKTEKPDEPIRVITYKVIN